MMVIISFAEAPGWAAGARYSMLGNHSHLSGFSTPTTRNYSYVYKNKAANYLDLPGSFTSGEESNGFPNSIGEYGMGRLLGRGAFGSVYEVTEIRHKTPLNDFKYAIKIVKDDSHPFIYSSKIDN